MEIYDLIVIGAGPGGYTAAIRAAQYGLRVALIEKGEAGGTCLQRGCIPKEILHAISAHFIETQHYLEEQMYTGDIKINLPGIISASKEKLERITKSLEMLIVNCGVTIIRGQAHFTDQETIKIIISSGTIHLKARSFIIATGCAPLKPSFLPEHERILTSTEALFMKEKPEHVIILGGGVIGCEFASFWNAIGTKVTIIERSQQLLYPSSGKTEDETVDEDIRIELQKYFEKQNISLFLGKNMDTCDADASGITVSTGNTTIRASHFLAAAGIMPATLSLGLKNIGIECDSRGFIPVTLPNYETHASGVYAIGDVISIPNRIHPCLAHVATAEAKRVAFHIEKKETKPIDYDNVPCAIFTIPEIASVGYTEKRASVHFGSNVVIETGKMPHVNSGLAIALDAEEGFKKIITRKRTFGKKTVREILGYHVIGKHAAEEIGIITEARHAEDYTEHMEELILPHPTWNELLTEALEAIDGHAIHIPQKRKV